MRLDIIARKLIMPILFAVVIYVWTPDSAIIRDYGVRSPGMSLFLMIVVRCVVLFGFLIMWEVLIKQMFVKCSSRIRRRGRRAISEGSAYGALLAIRLDHCLYQLTFLLCQGWDFSGGGSHDRVWRGLSSWSTYSEFVRIARLLISVPVCLSVVSACCALRAYELPILQYFSEIIGLLIESISLGQLVNVIAVKVPAMVTLLPIFSIVFYLYFYSHKRRVRRLVENESLVYRKEVVLLYEKLLLWFERNAYDICLNFEYVVAVRSSLVELQIKRLFPESQSFDGVEFLRVVESTDYIFEREFREYDFLEIADTQELCDLVGRLSDDELDRFVREFSVYDEDIWDLYRRGFRWLRTVETVERSLFTKRGVRSWIEDREPYAGVVGQDVIGERKQQLESSLVSEIYEGLELLFRVERAMAALRRYLYSSRTEMLILKVLSREK